MMNCDFSVLVPMIHRRLTSYSFRLLEDLHNQARDLPVEILGFYDNQRRTTGEKRNGLLQLARGEFLTFVDDDDRIAPTYVADILQAIRGNPTADVICFWCDCSMDGGPPKLCKYSVTYGGYTDTPTLWTGLPAHTMVWRSDIAKSVGFEQKWNYEDMDWVSRAVPAVRIEVQIERVLYFYDSRAGESCTRGGSIGES